jgi:hypothetical protein
MGLLYPVFSVVRLFTTLFPVASASDHSAAIPLVLLRIRRRGVFARYDEQKHCHDTNPLFLLPIYQTIS